MTTAMNKLSNLRIGWYSLCYDLGNLMKENRVDAYLIPSEDQHMSEYVPECYQRRKWISKFTGSAGVGYSLMVRLII